MATQARTLYRTASFDDAGLRTFFNHVSLVFGLGLLVTALVSEVIAQTGLMQALYNVDAKHHVHMSGWWIGAAVLQLGLVWIIASPKTSGSDSFASGLSLFGLYTALSGFTLAPVLYTYTSASVAATFFAAAATFGGSALWGYVTKWDMTKYSGLFIMGLIGLIVATLVNMFIGSTVMGYAISFFGIALFVGITAWDMQMFRDLYYQHGPTPGLVVNAALAFYLDFLNLFLLILRLIGVRAKA